MSKTVKKYIENVIEDFAGERRIGADSSRQTGLSQINVSHNSETFAGEI